MSDETLIDGIDYGPLAALVGTWTGARGMDVSPEPEGDEHNPYFETLTFEAVGSVTNAGNQTLAALRYHQVVHRESTGEVFHNETGYWMWDDNEGRVMQALTIPRGVALLAGGPCPDPKSGTIEVEAAADDPDWGIAQSPFMRDNARTVAFRHRIEVSGERLSYRETTVVDIYGRRVDHTDENVLTRAV